MCNYVLVCHGGLRDYSSFTLARGQEVQYRGNFGASLGYGTALAIWQALRDNPTISDEQLSHGIHNYHPQEPLRGPNTYGPDIDLEGDDNLFLFMINLNTRAYITLGSNWRIRLSQLVAIIGDNGRRRFWLNLLCCTQFDGSGIQMPSGAHLVSRFQDIV